MSISDTRNKKVLVVDDEISICIICERILKSEGFSVDIVHDGESAEKAISENEYDLLLIDIRLPKKNGMDLFIWMKQEQPQTAKNVIFMSGGLLGTETNNFLEHSGRPYLLKPFRPDELKKIVRDTLGY